MAFVGDLKRLLGFPGVVFSAGAGVGVALLALNLMHTCGLVDEELFPVVVWRVCWIGLVLGAGSTIILRLWTAQPTAKGVLLVSLAIGTVAGAVTGLIAKPHLYFAVSFDGRMRCFVSFYERPAPRAECIYIVNAAVEKAEKHPRPEWRDPEGGYWIPHQYSYRSIPVSFVILMHVLIGFVPFWAVSFWFLGRRFATNKSAVPLEARS